MFQGEPCPDCTGTDDRKWPFGASPRAIRRGRLTRYLSEDVPVEIIGDKMAVSRDVLDKHSKRDPRRATSNTAEQTSRPSEKGLRDI